MHSLVRNLAFELNGIKLEYVDSVDWIENYILVGVIDSEVYRNKVTIKEYGEKKRYIDWIRYIVI